jgi:hypothetical protein
MIRRVRFALCVPFALVAAITFVFSLWLNELAVFIEGRSKP